MNYKIGDHVVVDKSNVEEWNYHGKTGIITDTDLSYGFPYLVEMDDGSPKSWSTVSGLVEDKKVFTKNDLQNGDMVLRANGVVEVFVSNPGVFVGINGFMPLHKVNRDLTHTGNDHGWDIVAVRRPEHNHDCQFTAFKAELGELVYERERDTKKLYNGKVVCIDNHYNEGLYTVGKIYQFVDGSFTTDNNSKIKDWRSPVESFDDFNRWTSSKFIEIKE